MGHCEMGLAVAGLKDDEIADRTKKLAGGDWSHLPAAHQAALTFARKQAVDPWRVTAADLKALEGHWGPEKVWHVVFWSARCHYMTRVADAFQLPLERDNVFLDSPAQPGKR
jgi:hypothetical protein